MEGCLGHLDIRLGAVWIWETYLVHGHSCVLLNHGEHSWYSNGFQKPFYCLHCHLTGITHNGAGLEVFSHVVLSCGTCHAKSICGQLLMSVSIQILFITTHYTRKAKILWNWIGQIWRDFFKFDSNPQLSVFKKVNHSKSPTYEFCSKSTFVSLICSLSPTKLV